MQNWIYTPENIDLNVPPELENGVRWLISTCYFYKVALWKERREHWAYLSADLLHKVVGQNIKPIRKAAVDAGLVECDNHYIVGQKCIGYRLGPVLSEAKFVRWPGDGKVFLNRYQTFKELWTSTTHLDDLGLYLHKWACKVKISRRVHSLIAQMPEEKALHTRHQLEILKAGFVKSTFCDFGRFHTNFTRIAKEVRSTCLTINGEPLYEIDVVGSQVLLLAELLAEHYPYNINNYTNTISTLPYDCTFSSDFFVDLIQSTTYDHFNFVHDWGSRDAAKKEFFHCVYGPQKLNWMFAKVWPDVGKTLKKIKRSNEEDWVPREMQRREAKIILRGVCDYLRLSHPKTPLLTCHDSILTTRDNLDLVAEVMRNQLSHLQFFNHKTGLRMPSC